MTSKVIAISIGILALAYVMLWRNYDRYRSIQAQLIQVSTHQKYPKPESLNQKVAQVRQILEPQFAVKTSTSGVCITAKVEQLESLADILSQSSIATDTKSILWQLNDSGGECNVEFK
jgi:hypothetical protein